MPVDRRASTQLGQGSHLEGDAAGSSAEASYPARMPPPGPMARSAFSAAVWSLGLRTRAIGIVIVPNGRFPRGAQMSGDLDWDAVDDRRDHQFFARASGRTPAVGRCWKQTNQDRKACHTPRQYSSSGVAESGAVLVSGELGHPRQKISQLLTKSGISTVLKSLHDLLHTPADLTQRRIVRR